MTPHRHMHVDFVWRKEDVGKLQLIYIPSNSSLQILLTSNLTHFQIFQHAHFQLTSLQISLTSKSYLQICSLLIICQK